SIVSCLPITQGSQGSEARVYRGASSSSILLATKPPGTSAGGASLSIPSRRRAILSFLQRQKAEGKKQMHTFRKDSQKFGICIGNTLDQGGLITQGERWWTAGVAAVKARAAAGERTGRDRDERNGTQDFEQCLRMDAIQAQRACWEVFTRFSSSIVFVNTLIKQVELSVTVWQGEGWGSSSCSSLPSPSASPSPESVLLMLRRLIRYITSTSLIRARRSTATRPGEIASLVCKASIRWEGPLLLLSPSKLRDSLRSRFGGTESGSLSGGNSGNPVWSRPRKTEGSAHCTAAIRRDFSAGRDRDPFPALVVSGVVALHQCLPAAIDACDRCPPARLIPVQCPPASPVVHKFTLAISRAFVKRRGRWRAALGQFISMRDEEVFHAVHGGGSLTSGQEGKEMDAAQRRAHVPASPAAAAAEAARRSSVEGRTF
ncbi:hypothetical protein FQN60_016666, partial [Etheostoma spectabile]